MKRILLSLLGTMLVVCSVNAQVLKGDMNGDGTLTAADIATLVDHILNDKKEYISSGVANANDEIMKTWYVSKVDFIKFNSTSAMYNGTNYSKYAYYPALNVILIYDSDNAVKYTFVVKEKTDTSMSLLLPNGTIKKYYSTCPPALVESITLTAGLTSLYTAYTPLSIPPETTTITASVSPYFADSKEVEWTITQDDSRTKSIAQVGDATGSTITVRSARSGGATITATAKDGSGVSASIHIDTHARPTVQAVDLGTGVKWASMNVGANAPEEIGRYYAWGETSAYGETPSAYPSSFTGTKNSGYTSLTTKTECSWANYKYCKGASNTLTKYCDLSIYGEVDNITTLDMDDDAARANLFGEWRMPTVAECNKLLSECYWQLVTSYNGKSVTGYVVYKAKNSADKGKIAYNGKTPTLAATYSLTDTHIFIPLGGRVKGNQVLNDLSKYWTSSNAEINSNFALTIAMTPDQGCICNGSDSEYRYYALPIRAVCP